MGQIREIPYPVPPDELHKKELEADTKAHISRIAEELHREVASDRRRDARYAVPLGLGLGSTGSALLSVPNEKAQAAGAILTFSGGAILGGFTGAADSATAKVEGFLARRQENKARKLRDQINKEKGFPPTERTASRKGSSGIKKSL